jgi:hypothetical protein
LPPIESMSFFLQIPVGGTAVDAGAKILFGIPSSAI